MKKIILLLLTMTIWNMNSQNSASLKELVNIMQGSYTSERQAKSDTTYYSISLKMIPIWKDKGNFLYVEQALSSKIDKPYRVRIYEIVETASDAFVSKVYTLRNENNWIGKWKTPEKFDQLQLGDLELKNGCEVNLRRVAKNKFTGQTGKKTCASELRGASYATSEVTITATQILSWDRGFNSNDEQVWGAEKGGYIFDKI